MRKVLITGATRGIGKAIFDELSPCYDVYVTARNKELLKTLGAKGYFVCDLKSDNDVENLCNYIEQNKFDIIINNAGEYIYGGIEEMTNEQILSIYHTNLISPVKIISAAVPYMKEGKWGRQLLL